MRDKYEEVIIVIIAGTIIFLVLSAILVFILLFYQKKKFQHREQLVDMEKKFSEELLKSQLEMQEQTFNTISQEIHDNVGQILSLAKVQLNIIGQNNTLDKTLLSEAKESVSKALNDLRDIAKSLNTDRLKLLSLKEIIEKELQRINNSGVIKTCIQIEGKEQQIQENKKLIIFRMLQEALQNVLKHSKAKSIDVHFNYQPDHLIIKMTDNGNGFDKTFINKNEGLGLRNIINRALLIGGKANIHSVINEGTSITITSPYA